MILDSWLKGWNILIFVLLILVALYLLTLIVNIVFVVSFKNMMVRDNRGIRVSLSAKLDILRKAQEVIVTNGLRITEKCAHSLRYLDSEDFFEAQTEDFLKSTEELAMVEKEISGILFSSRKLAKNDEVELIKSLLKDVNESLKASTMAYNADVLGYNYWIRFTPCKFIFMLFKTKIKKTI